jgi:hypothetical protein
VAPDSAEMFAGGHVMLSSGKALTVCHMFAHDL